MSYININFKGGSSRLPGPASKFAVSNGPMPTRILCKLFMSTLAAMLAVHFWRQRGR
jgi:hypothetical protein